MSATQPTIRLFPRKPLTQVLSVLIGYVLSFIIASWGVYLLDRWIDRPEADAYQGMSAGGDLILFLVLFGCLAAIPTLAGLLFMRTYPQIWPVLSTAALALSTTGLAALGGFLLGTPTVFGVLSFLRILLAPGLVLVMTLAAIVAPVRGARIGFLGAALCEMLVCALTLLHLFTAR